MRSLRPIAAAARRLDPDASLMAKLRDLLGDDHTLVRQGLRKILEEQPDWEVVAEAGDGREAVRQALRARSPTSRSSTSACRC